MPIVNTGAWRDAHHVSVEVNADVMFDNSADGKFCWNIMGATLAYAASLIGEISDDIVNVDRAMRWGFAWGKGPFELLDAVGPKRFLDKCRAEGFAPEMLTVLESAGAEMFYTDNGTRFLGLDGKYHPVPAE